MPETERAEETQAPPSRAVAVVMDMIGHLGRVERDRPDSAAECLMELSHAMSTAAKAIRRGFVTGAQLADMRRRCGLLEAKTA